MLGLKEGTVSSRLDGARKQLQKRLAGRGIALSAVLGATALTQQAARAAVPRALAESTVRAAPALVQGVTTGVSAPVAALVEGGLRAMFKAQAKVVTGLALALGLAAGGAGLLARHQPAAQ